MLTKHADFLSLSDQAACSLNVVYCIILQPLHLCFAQDNKKQIKL